MKPKEYELLVAEHFRQKGYDTTITPDTNDFGVDIFARKGNDKLAIQVKMYGKTTRKINRQMVMELFGAKAYFDCTKAVIATNGNILENVIPVAAKLGIEILQIEAIESHSRCQEKSKSKEEAVDFEYIWERYIMPLEGRVLTRENGQTNKIVKVDWGGIQRITSNGKPQKIKIKIFKLAIKHILKKGSILRKEINEEYQYKASSGIVLI